MTKLHSRFAAVVPAPPDVFYKFRSFGALGRHGSDEAAVFDLLCGRLRFADITTFNDPFENRPHYVPAYEDVAKQRKVMIEYISNLPIASGKTRSARRRAAEQAMSGRTMREMVDLANQKLSDPKYRTGLELFCGSGPGAVATPLPWSHYADSHRGVCVQLRGDLYPLKLSFPVEYSDEYPVLKVPRIAEDRSDVIFTVVLRKCTDWKYEREYRVVRNMDLEETNLAKNLGVSWDGNVAIASPGIAIGITLGALMPPDVRARLIDWVRANAPSVRIWQASLHPSRYEIVQTALDP